MSDYDHYLGNILQRVEALERRMDILERVLETGMVKDNEVYIPGEVHFDLPLRQLRLLDATTSGTTDDGAIKVSYDGWVQYIHTKTTP